MMGYNTGYMGYGWGPGHLVGGILEFLFWILIVIVILRLVRGRKMGWRHRWGGDKSALSLLEERYVKGEIGKEEFEQKKKDLMS